MPRKCFPEFINLVIGIINFFSVSTDINDPNEPTPGTIKCVDSSNTERFADNFTKFETSENEL
jgi:hypothetical protein